MSNFTMIIKRELLAKKIKERRALVASVSAFMRTGGCISFTQEGLGFVFVTESERVAEYYLSAIENLYGVECLTNAAEDKLRGRDKFTLSYNGEKAYDILIETGVFERNSPEEGYDLYAGIPARIVSDEESKLAYIRGAFLGGGSCTLPRTGSKTGYHLEFVFSHEETAQDFVAILEEYQLISKVVPRKDTFVVYIASRAAISDFLSVAGAYGALEKLNETAEAREENNNSNRVNNCFVGNMDRTATAAAKQCVAMSFLLENGFLSPAEEELRTVAAARLENREASLSELASAIGVSKSCLNHRMRKLMELYEEEIKERKDGEK